jgi:hypothetical protein
MPVTVTTPTTATDDIPPSTGDDAATKALLVAALLLAEELTKITPLIIENAAATRDLSERIEKLFAKDESKTPTTPPDTYAFADKYDFLKEPDKEEHAESIQSVYVVGPDPLNVYDAQVLAAVNLLRLEFINQLGKPKEEPKEPQQKKEPDYLRPWLDAVGSTLRGFIVSGNVGQAAPALGGAVAKTVGTGLEAAGAGALAGPVGAVAGSVAEKILGTITSPIDAIKQKFESVLGPMAILNASLNSVTSGFSTVGKVVNILGATLGSLFLPFTLAAGAALLAISDIIWSVVEPSLGDWIGITETLGEAFLVLAGIAAKTASIMLQVALGLAKAYLASNPLTSKKEDEKLLAPFEKLEHGLDDVASGIAGRIGAAAGAAAGGDDGRGGKPPGGVLGGEIRSLLFDLKKSFGPQAAFAGIADVGKQIQLAALNKSPLEAKLLERVDKIIGIAERAASGGGGRPVAPHAATGEILGDSIPAIASLFLPGAAAGFDR